MHSIAKIFDIVKYLKNEKNQKLKKKEKKREKIGKMAQKVPKWQKDPKQTHTHTHTFDIQNFFFHPITEYVIENCLQRILSKLIFGIKPLLNLIIRF